MIVFTMGLPLVFNSHLLICGTSLRAFENQDCTLNGFQLFEHVAGTQRGRGYRAFIENGFDGIVDIAALLQAGCFQCGLDGFASHLVFPFVWFSLGLWLAR